VRVGVKVMVGVFDEVVNVLTIVGDDGFGNVGIGLVGGGKRLQPQLDPAPADC